MNPSSKVLLRWSRRPEAAPDVAMAIYFDCPTMESLPATTLLCQHLPEVKVGFVNVVDLFKLVPNTEHLHQLTDRKSAVAFTSDKPVVFNFHGYLRFDPLPRLPAAWPAQHPRERPQGASQRQHAAGAGHPQPDRPLQSGHRRDRPDAAFPDQQIERP
jgi:XFP C-terminal domain